MRHSACSSAVLAREKGTGHEGARSLQDFSPLVPEAAQDPFEWEQEGLDTHCRPAAAQKKERLCWCFSWQGDYRAALCKEWMRELLENDIPHSEDASLINTLGDPVEIRSWQASWKKKRNQTMLEKDGASGKE